MVDVESLWYNSSFIDYLSTLCSRNHLIESDDYKQEVFLLLIDGTPKKIKECKEIAKRLAERTSYRNRNRSIKALSFDDEFDSFAGRVIA